MEPRNCCCYSPPQHKDLLVWPPNNCRLARPQPSPAHTPSPPSAGGKRSTAGFKRRAGEVSLSMLAQTVLGKPLDKSQQASGALMQWLVHWCMV